MGIVQYQTTGLDGLDHLLDGRGLPLNSNVLICGEPGTGKTTFVWHLVAEMLRPPSPPASQQRSVCICSPEEDVVVSLERFLDSYNNSSVSHLEEELKNLKANDESRRIWPLTMESPADGQDPWSYFRILSHRGRPYSLCVVDGLNAVLDLSAVHFHRCGERELMTVIERSFRHQRKSGVGPSLVVMTAEDRSDRPSRWSESYVADVTIELIFSDILPDARQPNLRERILTCRVTKARGIHVQRRDACYEFVNDKGISFFETYAAEGLLSLFHENKPQYDAIEQFRERDCPSFYPRLSVRDFTRSNMNHEYAVRRYARDIPRRRPMLLSNIDEYWVSTLNTEDGLLKYVPIDDLQLYGRTDGRLIWELDREHKAWLHKADSNGRGLLVAVPHFVNVSLLVYRKNDPDVPLNSPPETWEALEELCASKKTRADADREIYPFLIETKTVDSFIAFILELCWSHGGGWHTKPVLNGDGQLEHLQIQYDKDQSEAGVIAALARFHRWVHKDRIVRPHSTIDVRHEKYPAIREDWIVARHWYSTLIDLVTFVDNAEDVDVRPRLHELGVGKIPVALHAPEGATNAITPRSTWGEWYLGIEKGTENTALAISLLNNLLSSAKIINRAVTGGGLPVVEQFYEQFGEANCFGTDKTFSQVRSDFCSNAISRSEYCEYRYVLQRVYAGAFQLMTNDGGGKASEDIASEVWSRVAAQIESHEAFAHRRV